MNNIPSEMSAIQLGELLSVNEREIRRLAERGVVVKSSPGRYRTKESMMGYSGHLHTERAKGVLLPGDKLHTKCDAVAKVATDLQARALGLLADAGVTGGESQAIVALFEQLRNEVLYIREELMPQVYGSTRA